MKAVSYQPSAISLQPSEETSQNRFVIVEDNAKMIVSFDFKLSIIPHNKLISAISNLLCYIHSS